MPTGEFAAAAGLVEMAGVDSLWLPETVDGPRRRPEQALNKLKAIFAEGADEQR